MQPSCSSCGADLPPASRFCNRCGEAVGDPSSMPAASERAPRDYTPRHIADKILNSRSALEGERKQVTVFFADVKSSTQLAGDVDAEDWHAILDRFFQLLSEGGSAGSTSPCASASTRARSWWERSATTCAWITPLRVTP